MTAPEPQAVLAAPPVRIADTRPPTGRLLDVEVEGVGLFKAYWRPDENGKLPLGHWSLQWPSSRRFAFTLAHANDRWSEATSAEVERRDDTAELVEFLERIGAFDENLEAANSPELLPCFNQRLYDEWKQLSIAARAALARVKGGERS